MKTAWMWANILLYAGSAVWITANTLPEPEPEPPLMPALVAQPPDSTFLDLRARIGSAEHGTEIARAIIEEADRSGLSINLILGIMRTENPWMKPDTVNSYGAVGLMQVVGWLHDGDHPECGSELTDIRTNVCYGVKIFERKLAIAKGNVPLALLFYNGCWGETYTEGCEVYPDCVNTRGAI